MHSSSKARAVPSKHAHTHAARPVLFALELLATVHIVMFYITRVPSYLSLSVYEQGRERMPFQGRMLMVYPLRWAHQSAALAKAAGWLTATRMWVPRTVLPEDIVEFVLDVAAVAFAGFVATQLYRARGEKGRLVHYVYPLFLVMVAGSYCLVSMNFIRYVYDLPSLGLFAAGLYFIYIKDRPGWFALTFLCATLNRETSIFLLLFFVHNRCHHAQRFQWKRLWTPAVGGVAAALALFWWCFHLWLAHHFGTAPADVKPGLLTNILLLLWPFAWPQFAAVGAYTFPLLLLLGRRQWLRSDPFPWMWVLPLWAALMFAYGSIVEIRLFGEFLPLLACTAVLVAETELLSDAHGKVHA